MIQNPAIQGGGELTYETCTITFSGDFGERASGASADYENGAGELVNISLKPYPEKILCRKGSVLRISGNAIQNMGFTASESVPIVGAAIAKATNFAYGTIVGDGDFQITYMDF